MSKKVRLIVVFLLSAIALFIAADSYVPDSESQMLKIKENISDSKLRIEKISNKLIKQLENTPYNQISIEFKNINFQIYENNELVYWTDNRFTLEENDIKEINYNAWKEIKSDNSEFQIIKYPLNEQKDIVFILPIIIKYNYSNEYLQDNYDKTISKGVKQKSLLNLSPQFEIFYISILIFYAFIILFSLQKKSYVYLATVIFINILSFLYVLLILKFNIAIENIADININKILINLILFTNAYVLISSLRILKEKSFLLNPVLFFGSFFLIFHLSTYIYDLSIKRSEINFLIEKIKHEGYFEEDALNKILLERINQDIIEFCKDSSTKKISELQTIDQINYLTSDISAQYENKISFIYNDEIYQNILTDLRTSAKKINSSNFYQLPIDRFEYHYIGIFPINNTGIKYFTIEIKPRKDIKSLSFPNLLAPGNNNTEINSIKIFRNNQLVFSTGETNSNHKIYTDKEHQVEVGIMNERNWLEFLLYQFYLFSLGIVLYYTVYHLQNASRSNSIFRKFQLIFSSLIVLSFIGLLYFSSGYIKKKTEINQLEILNKKKFYIQSELQEYFYWYEDLSQMDKPDILKELNKLAYVYQTDIHLYDFSGNVIASSQPVLFEQNILSKRINPDIIFSDKFNSNIQENIGKLKYISGYESLINGDFLQLGFISIPQYLSESVRIEELESFLGSLIHFYVFIILLAFVIMRISTNKISEPIKLMMNKLKVMSIDGKNEKIDYTSNDEIGQLVRQYNVTVDELERNVKLLAQSERESAWRTMARQIAHEINNPLTPMKLTIQQLQRSKELDREHFEKYFERSTATLIEQINHLSGIASTFSNFARLPISQFSKIDIAARLYNTYQLFSNNHEHISLTFTGVEKGIYVFGDADQIGQVFTNLIKNAIQAIPHGQEGEVKIIIHKNNRSVDIHISDNGKGISDEIREKLFTPNFTTKTTGMGLGLAIVKNIVELHKGEISFTSVPDNGSDFILRFDTISALGE